MDGIRNAQAIVDPWWTYFNYCFTENPFATVCGPFWERIILGVVIVGALTVAFGAWKYFAYRRAEQAARIAEWEREQVDEVGVREASWNGDKAYQSLIPDEELQRQIREGIEQRKREARSPPAAP